MADEPVLIVGAGRPGWSWRCFSPAPASGRAGKIQAGDRMPFVPLPAGAGDNMAYGTDALTAAEVRLNPPFTSTDDECFQLPAGAPANQGLLVELSQISGSGARFVHDSAWVSMAFIDPTTATGGAAGSPTTNSGGGCGCQTGGSAPVSGDGVRREPSLPARRRGR
jgi:hypothetical protein